VRALLDELRCREQNGQRLPPSPLPRQVRRMYEASLSGGAGGNHQNGRKSGVIARTGAAVSIAVVALQFGGVLARPLSSSVVFDEEAVVGPVAPVHSESIHEDRSSAVRSVVRGRASPDQAG
jgi:hypothetical protein